MKRIMKLIFIALSVFCAAYYVILAVESMFRGVFINFWLAAAVISFSIYIIIKAEESRKLKLPKTLCRAFCILFFAGATLFVALEAAIVVNSFGEPRENADYCIILGAGVEGEQPSVTLNNRIKAAAEYLKKNPGTIAVATGGLGSRASITEAEAIRRTLVSLGIDESRIMLETLASNTSENLLFSAEIIGEDAENCRIVVVTSTYHILRAKLIAEKCGFMNVEGLGAAPYPITTLNYYVREFFAIVKDVIFGNA